jgi:hypothetical protein
LGGQQMRKIKQNSQPVDLKDRGPSINCPTLNLVISKLGHKTTPQNFIACDW